MQPDAVTLFDAEFLGQELDLGNYQLQKGCEGEIIEPIEACEKLYVVADGKAVAVINDYCDLSAYVNRVASAAQAEAFLRLVTSPETFHLFERGRIEIDCRFVERYREPVYAQISMDDAARLQLHPMKIVQTETGYQVERCLYVWALDVDRAVIHQLRENIGADGSYIRVSDFRINDTAFRKVHFPVYE